VLIERQKWATRSKKKTKVTSRRKKNSHKEGAAQRGQISKQHVEIKENRNTSRQVRQPGKSHSVIGKVDFTTLADREGVTKGCAKNGRALIA